MQKTQLPSMMPIIAQSLWQSQRVTPEPDALYHPPYHDITRLLQQHGPNLLPHVHWLEISDSFTHAGLAVAPSLTAALTCFSVARSSLQPEQLPAALKDSAVANFRLVRGDFHQLPFSDASFNVVCVHAMLHRSWHYPQVIRELLRVLTPHGLLLIEDEPLLRSFCFYKFRCNRPAEFTVFEKKLFELDLLRTIAEPFVGSRPETQFGMIVNQTIPCSSLLDVITPECTVLSLQTETHASLGNWETYWLNQRQSPAHQIAEAMIERLLESTHSAAPLLHAKEQGLEFTLPSEQEIRVMAQRISQELCALPADENNPCFQQQLARIFGARLWLVARKKEKFADLPALIDGSSLRQKALEFTQKTRCESGIYNGFPNAEQPFLDPLSLIPDIQTAGPAKLRAFFPSDQWQWTSSVLGAPAAKRLVNLTTWPEIHIPIRKSKVPSLLILQLECEMLQDHFYRLDLLASGNSIYHAELFQPEAILCRVILTPRLLADCQQCLILRLAPIPPDDISQTLTVAIRYAALYPIPGMETVPENKNGQPWLLCQDCPQ